jgi:uncharacterized membrane protein
MGKINVGRVILGGLVAGLIINISEYVLNTYVVAEESAAIMERMGVAQPGMQQIAWFLLMTFVVGILIVFLYAGLRPRFGAGARTAVIAGVTVWIVAMMGTAADTIMGILPSNLLLLAGAWSLVETVVAAVVGAWLYQESA